LQHQASVIDLNVQTLMTPEIVTEITGRITISYGCILNKKKARASASLFEKLKAFH